MECDSHLDQRSESLVDESTGSLGRLRPREALEVVEKLLIGLGKDVGGSSAGFASVAEDEDPGVDRVSGWES